MRFLNGILAVLGILAFAAATELQLPWQDDPAPPTGGNFDALCERVSWRIVPGNGREFKLIANCGVITNMTSEINLDTCLGNDDGMLTPWIGAGVTQGCDACHRINDTNPAQADWQSDELFCWCLGVGQDPKWYLTGIKPGEFVQLSWSSLGSVY